MRTTGFRDEVGRVNAPWCAGRAWWFGVEEVAAVDAGVAGVCCRRSDGSKKAMDELVVKGIPAMGKRFAVTASNSPREPIARREVQGELIEVGLASEP